jgi:hypothetical protein
MIFKDPKYTYAHLFMKDLLVIFSTDKVISDEIWLIDIFCDLG